MFKNFIFVLFFVSLVSCVERDVYRVRRHEVVEQVEVPAPAVVTETEIISEPREVIVPERVIIVRRHGRRVIVRP